MMGFRNEHVLRMKVGKFRKAYLTNCDKILNVVIFVSGIPCTLLTGLLFENIL